MATKFTSILLLAAWMLLIGCNSKEPLPINTWSQWCVELAPYQEGYRLSGICCAYVLLPKVALDKNNGFSVRADYYTFTGAGFASISTVVNGQLSPDGKTLVITYLVNSVATTHTLQPGPATASCFCGCD